jgi:hypothetical protein
MSLEYMKPTVYDDGALGGKVERAALFHLHGWKGADEWEYQEDGWKAPVVRDMMDTSVLKVNLQLLMLFVCVCFYAVRVDPCFRP